MSNTPCGTTSKLAHHIAIYNSIDNVRSVAHQIRELKARLNNEPSGGCDEKVEVSEPSFIEVLTNTPDNIIAECNAANQILSEIEEMLF